MPFCQVAALRRASAAVAIPSISPRAHKLTVFLHKSSTGSCTEKAPQQDPHRDRGNPLRFRSHGSRRPHPSSRGVRSTSALRPVSVVVAAHVYLYQESRGLVRPLPDGSYPLVRHRCGEPSCLNPIHLAAGTAADSAARLPDVCSFGEMSAIRDERRSSCHVRP